MNNMTDSEFQMLLNLNKEFLKGKIKLPQVSEKAIFEVKSITTSDKFLVDIDRKSKIEFSKFKIQNRFYLTKQPLIRIDIDSPPHLNPNGIKTSRNHIHIFKEDENDTDSQSWAYNLDAYKSFNFGTEFDFNTVFFKFCEYCHINSKNIQGVIL